MVTDYDPPPELLAMLRQHEGFRARAYQDQLGVWTVGIGRNLQSPGLSKEEVITLLQRVDVPDDVAMQFLHNDVISLAHQVSGVVGDSVWEKLNLPRQAALIDMGMMGPAKLTTFVKLLVALRDEQWGVAHDEVLNSQWAKQVGSARAGSVADLLLTGEWPKKEAPPEDGA